MGEQYYLTTKHENLISDYREYYTKFDRLFDKAHRNDALNYLYQIEEGKKINPEQSSYYWGMKMLDDVMWDDEVLVIEPDGAFHVICLR